ncbi:hypothetical protein [Actinoplanes regularis]|nr:hypothetical protein [Actinoplanes regularis]
MAEGIAARIGCAGYGAGSVVTALATLWIMDKLNNLVDRGN